MGIEEGDVIEIEVANDTATLIPKRFDGQEPGPFWTRKWQEGEKEADEDIRAGRVKTFESVDELLEELG